MKVIKTFNLVLIVAILLDGQSFAKRTKDTIDIHANRKDKITTYKGLYLYKDVSDFDILSFEKSRLNLTSLKGASRTKFIQIRGVGERSDYTPLVYRSVGLFHEGIDYSNYPQALNGWGTFKQRVTYGPRISERIAGAIESFESFESDRRFHLSFSNETSRQLGALYKDKKISLSIFKKDSDGFYTNDYLRRDTNKRNEIFLRASYDFSSFKQTIHYNKQQNGYDAFSLNNDFVTASDRPGQDNLELLVLRSEKKINNTNLWYEFFKVNTLYSYDEDWAASNSYDYNINFEKKRIRHSTGFLHKYNDLTFRGEYVAINEDQTEHGFNSGVTRKYIIGEVKRKSVDLNISYSKVIGKSLKLSSTFSLMKANISYYNNKSFDEKKQYYPLSLSTALKYGDSYLKLSMGSKSGGFSTQESIPDNRKVFDKEELYSIDTGHEFTFSNISLIQRMNLFINSRKNTQVTTSYQDNPSDPSSFTFYIDNAASSFSYGLESKTTFLPTGWLTIILDMGLIKSQYGDYSVGSRELRNRELPYTPSYQLRLLNQVEVYSNMYTSIIFNKQDNYYFSNSHDQKGDGFETFDLSFSYKKRNFKYSIFVNNIFNEDYQTRGFYFGNRPPNFQEELFTQRGRPRAVGVALDFAY